MRLPTIEERWRRHIDNTAAVMQAAIDSTTVRDYRPYRRGVSQLFIGSWILSALFLLVIPAIAGPAFIVSLLSGSFLLLLAASRRSFGELQVVGRQMTLLVAGHGMIGLIGDQAGFGFLFLLVAVLLLLIDKNLSHLYKEEG